MRRLGDRASLLACRLLLCSLALLWPALASAQHTSAECPPQTGTVSAGGTVTINISDCEYDYYFGGDGAVDGGSYGPLDFEDHGTATLRHASGQWFLDYSNNGSGTTDVFEFADGSLTGAGDVRVTITITPSASAITVSPASLPTLTAGTPFSQTLTSSGGVTPYTYNVQSGALPPGLTLSSSGILSGTPTQRGAYSFSVRSTDSTSPTAQFVDKGYTGTVANPTLMLTTASGTAIQNVAFTQTLATSGGVAPYTYMLETGSFPAGITVSSAGVVSGTTAAAPGNYPVTIRVTDASTGPGSYFEVENYTLTVSPPPSVAIAVSPASVSEDGATNLTYTVTRSLNLSSPTVVNITTTGTATAGTDYTGSAATVTIPAGVTTATLTIDPTADGTVEANETVILNVAAGTGYTVGVPSSATGTILNDDVPTATITVSPAAVAEDGAPNLVYTVTLNQASASALSVNYTVGGTATSGTDYAAIASPLVIAAGNTVGTITVNPTADATIESDETVTLTLAAGAGYIVGAPNNATGTILNDDLPNLTINDVTASEGNAGTTNFTFTVSLSAPAGPGGVSFDIATANGTATAGVDYVAQSLTGQTIPAGSSSYTFTVLVNGDALNEPSETYFVNVTNVTNAIVADGQGVGTIVNDDPLPSMSINDVAVVEGNAGTTNATFTVTLGATSGQTVSVNYATADGTATAGSDYTATSGTLTFAPGQTTQTVTVLVNGETVPEANETFFVNLSGASNATISDNQGVGTITNDDVPVTVSPATVPSGTVATAYSQTITASGGVAPYSFAVTAGSVPTGLTLSAGGVLSGTPTAGGTFNFTITATDSSPFPGPFAGSRAYTLTIAAPTITLPATALAGGTLGSAYSEAITAASGGTAPYSYAVTAGGLPGGLTLNPSTGAITGTPSALGTFNFGITATDSSTGTGPYSATQSYAITVIDVAPVANPVSATVAYDSSANPITLNVSGGAPTSVAIGTAPAHGTATATGTTITYTPTAGYAGPDSFTYTATNTGGTSAPATATITVSDPVITITASGALAASVAVPYSQTFTFNGGASPWSGFQVTNLPAGLSITGTTANSVTVSGTPTQAGTFNLNVSATDSSTGNGPYTVGQAFALVVSGPALALAPAGASFNAPYGVPYSQAFTASGGTGPYTYAATGTLPPGITFSGNTLSGTATTPGSYSFTITATDTGSTGTGAPFTVAESYTIDVGTPTIVVNPASLPDPTAGTTYSQALTASGGVAPYTFAVTAGALPNGITLASNGTLSGTTNTVGTFNFTVTATDANGQTGSRAYTLTIAAPVLSMTPAPGTLNAPYGAAYSQAFTASGGSGNFSYVLTGSLPAGMSFSGNTLSGTPTVPGSYPITVTATDTLLTGPGAPFSIAQNYTVDVPAPTIVVTPATLPNPTANTAYSQTINASGGVAPYVFAVTAGALPAGLSLNPTTGVITGTSNTVGTFNFTITATDANGQLGLQAYTLTIAAPVLSMTPALGTLNAPYGAAYSQAFTASGGSGNFSYVLTGSLPAGMSFSGNTLSGTPTAPGSYPITVTATDTLLTGPGAPFSIAQNYTVDVPAPTIVVTPATLPNPTANTAYSQTINASGGVAPYVFAVTAGALPAGLSLNPTTGVITGTSNTVGTFNFTITATDANGQLGLQAYTLTIAAPVLSMTPAPGTLNAPYGAAYSQAFTASGGSGNFSYVLTGSLPAGMSFSGNTLSGTPTVPGSYPITVTATDTTLTGVGAPFSIAQNYTIDVPAPTIVVDPATLPDTTAGLAYSQSISASGGVAPYAFTVTAGSLPNGLTLAGDGTLAGTTTTSGTFNFSVTASDANGQAGNRAYTVVVAVPTLTVTPATLPAGTAGNAYSQTLSISGGIAPYTVVASGTLPTGLTFDPATLTYSGTPTQSGTFNVSVTVTDSTGGTAAIATNNYTLVIAAPTLTLTPSTLPAGTAGVTYAQTFVASGGIAPYAYAVSAGALPAGISLDAATGALSGTPTVAGSFSFSVTATDSTTGTAGTITQAYTLEVSAPTITLTPDTLPAGTYMVAYTQQMSAAGGTAPYQYAVTAGALPAGITLSQAGQLSGSPSVTGAFGFTVTATDALGFTGERAYTLTVEARPDPAQDAEVRGLINAQAEAARRFASSQINNFQRRLQQLHGDGDSSGFSNGLSMAMRQSCVPGLDIGPGNNRCDLRRQTPFDAEGSALDDERNQAATSTPVATAFGVWAAGMLRSGALDSRGNTSELAFETDGMSAGADYRLNDRMVLGMGVGYGRDRTHVGDNGSRSDARAYTLAGYASINPAERFFIDAVLGYQTLDFDLRRHVTTDGSMAAGSRNGSQWFGSVSAGTDMTFQSMQVTPYLRLDIARGELDGYAEQTQAPNALTYGKMDVDSSTGNAGVRFDWRRQTNWGSFSPQLKAEYQHDFSGDGTATVQYSDLLQMPFYRTSLDGYARSRWILGAGMQFDWTKGWGLRFDYRAQMGGDASDHGLELHVDAKF
ncbi:putative Ig domain-containing protein [Thermomonas sp. XSG]|uniref:putative Ig domain-containing protein n=1 Tax=Thermomonas sp. XSG TaxID=2771436 RepID=UPI001680001A|nr:putative Ig domain-containing protein [Thermomonas sp. XSG]QNU15842.1 autotransporter domain-containing protein [Thermomonas sp. XSG]